MRPTDVNGGPPSADDTDAHLHATRRHLLTCASTGLVGALAGCAGLTDDSTPEELQFERLQATAVYVEEGVDLSMPDEVGTVRATNNADLLVLPGDTGVEAEQAVDWLAADRVLALLGDDTEASWLAWARSDAFSDAFENRGVADSDPDPQLLVAAAVDRQVTTYRRTWADGPRDRDVLRALDETLVDLAERTPA